MKLSVRARIVWPSGFDLDIAEACEAEGLGIVGPSGSGKSTLLHAIAGFLPAEVAIDGIDGSRQPPEDRAVGYVVQDALLFPHMSVRENLLYSPRAQGLGDVPDALGLAPLLDRMPRHLSGGERKRVALARAILSRPRLLCLDEPFSGLDDTRRREAMSLLHHVRRSYQLPMVLVSHIAEEIIGLCDLAMRLEAGRVIARGPTLGILRQGETRIDNYVTARVIGRSHVRLHGFDLHVSLPEAAAGDVRLACYAHDIVLAREEPKGISARNVVPSTIRALHDAGGAVLADMEELPLRALLTRESVATLHLEPGAQVYAVFKATSMAYLGRA